MTKHWVLIEAQNPDRYPHVVIGPFDTNNEAYDHMDSFQVDGFCEEDALDAWLATDGDMRKHTAIWTAAGEPWGTCTPVPDDK